MPDMSLAKLMASSSGERWICDLQDPELKAENEISCKFDNMPYEMTEQLYLTETEEIITGGASELVRLTYHQNCTRKAWRGFKVSRRLV